MVAAQIDRNALGFGYRLDVTGKTNKQEAKRKVGGAERKRASHHDCMTLEVLASREIFREFFCYSAAELSVGGGLSGCEET